MLACKFVGLWLLGLWAVSALAGLWWVVVCELGRCAVLCAGQAKDLGELPRSNVVWDM